MHELAGIELPRFGIVLGFPRELERVRWFGNGPGESYPDSHAASLVGAFESTIDAMHTPYVFPQENGSRMGTRWLELTGPGGGIRIESPAGISFSVRRWRSAELDRAQHDADLQGSDNVWLEVDVDHTGLGSGSCGPGPLPNSRVAAGSRQLSLTFSSMP
jgi:beta-galactosidase